MSCALSFERRHQECQWEDQGYDECTASRDEGYRDCCDWWPCSWACKAWTWISHIVCVAWTWITHWVCVALVWITTIICLGIDALVTAVNAVLVTLESIFGWVLSAVTFFVELIMSIPVFGAFVRWALNLATHVVFAIAGAVDTGLGLIGIRPEKKLRVCTVILRDENFQPVASLAYARTMLQAAVDLYRRDANIRIIPLRPFYYSSGFAGAETVDDSWIIIDDEKSDREILDVPGGGEAAERDWGHAGSRFQLKSSTCCFFGSWRKVTGYGAPITCFFVRSVGNALGNALVLTDYARIQGGMTVPPASPRTLAHEVGHSCLLSHTCVDEDNQNFMATQDECSPASATAVDRVNIRMSKSQALLMRSSKHVTYF